MPYPKRPGASGNAITRSAGNFHPLEVPYKGLEVGDSCRIRFLDLSEESTRQIPCRECEIKNPKTGKPMKILVHEPEDPKDMKKLVDHYGNPMDSCPEKTINRAPVFLYSMTRKGVVEEVNALRYLEFTQGLANSLFAMKESHDGDCEFNEETHRPDYDVRLKIFKPDNGGQISKNYSFEAIIMATAKTKNKGEGGFDFGWQKEAEAVLEELGFMDEVADAWDEVQDVMDKKMTLEEIKAKLAKRKEGEGSTVGSKPGSRSADNEDDGDGGEDDSNENANTKDDDEEEPEVAPKRVARKYGSRG